MEIKHILIAVSKADYAKYTKQKGKRTWRQVLVDGLSNSFSQNRQE